MHSRHTEVCDYELRVSPLSLNGSSDGANSRISFRREGANESSSEMSDNAQGWEGSHSHVMLVATCAFCEFDEIIL